MASSQDISFGFFTEDPDAGGQQSPRSPVRPTGKTHWDHEPNNGLGKGLGGQTVRSCLGNIGASVVDPSPRDKKKNTGRVTVPRDMPAIQVPNLPDGSMPKSTTTLKDSEPPSLHLALILNDRGDVRDEDMQHIRNHRWTFDGAAKLASPSRGFGFFTRCLLDLQRNVQLLEDGDPLEPSLARACRTFVHAQVREGQAGEMYHMLAHFISNSLLFPEWDAFLQVSFADQRASQESFLVPHLEQVWVRFCRFRSVVETIFDILDTSYAWRNRLPKVGELLREHMRRRCFDHPHVSKNVLFMQ